MVADEPFSFRFLDVSGASDAQVPYFKWLGGPQEGREFLLHGSLWGSTLSGNHIKEPPLLVILFHFIIYVVSVLSSSFSLRGQVYHNFSHVHTAI